MKVRFVEILSHAQGSIAADCGAVVCGRGHARDVGEGVGERGCIGWRDKNLSLSFEVRPKALTGLLLDVKSA